MNSLPKKLAMVSAGTVLATGLVLTGFTPLASATPNDIATKSTVPAAAAGGSEIGQVTIHKHGDGTEPPAELGNPSEWGVVTIEMDASAGSVTPMSEACVPASGGDWCYGWYLTTSGKYCYSNYFHYSKSHKSSVEIANGSYSSGWVAANETSNAHLTAGAGFTCKTYYSIK